MRKRFFLFFLSLFFFFFICPISNAEERNDASSTIDIVMAIDVSGTMEGTKIKNAKKQAIQLCIICEKLNIKLSCITFSGIGEIKEIFKDEEIESEEKIFDLIEKIKSINCKGEYTDQLGAIQHAENILVNSDADFKYIIMLSDGMIDYVNRKGEAKKLTKGERDAYDAFQTSCINFAEEDNQGIFLVGYKNDVKMFSKIRDEENSLYYLYWKNNNSNFFNTIFNPLDYSINVKKEKTLKAGKIPFDLERGLSAAIVYIVRETDNKKSKILTEEKIITKKGEEPADIKCSSDSAIIYYDHPEGGDYILNLPKDVWSLDVIPIKDYRISSVDLKLFGEEKSEVTNNQIITEDSQKITLYTLDKFDSELNLQINVEGDDSDNKYIGKKLYLKKFETGKSEKEKWDEKQKARDLVSNVWSIKIDMPETETPIYYRVRVGNNGNYFYSNIIKIVYNEIIELKDIYKNEPIEFTELFTELDEDEILKKRLIVKEIIDGKEEPINDDKENDIYKKEDNKQLTFYKKGTYKITLKNSISKIVTVSEKKENFIDITGKFFINIFSAIKNFIINIFS